MERSTLTHISERGAVDDEHETARPLAIILANDTRDPSIDPMQRMRCRALLRPRLPELAELLKLVQDPTIREELLKGRDHLLVHRPTAVTAAPADNDNVGLGRDEVRAVADGNGGLEFVARGDPDLDPRELEVRDALGDAVLELVLDGGGAEEPEVALELLAGGLCLLFAVVEGGGSLVV